MYRDGEQWKPVELTSGAYATTKNAFCRIDFKPVTTAALRIEVQLQDGYSGGVMEWRVHPADK